MHRFDVHHHIVPPGYVPGVGEQRVYRQSGGRIPPLVGAWTPQKSIDAMDESGVATSITSVSAPGTWFGDVEQGRRLSRLCNEYAARLARDYPGRFGTFAALPLPDVEGSLREIAYAFDELKADGIVLMTSYDKRWPGEQEFAPVFEELNRRKAVVFFHPTTPDCCSGLISDVPDASIEFMFDTVRAVMSLLYSGTLSRCPDVRFIFCHNGSAVPLLKNRISALWRQSPKFAERIPNGPMHELQKLYYETAGSTVPEAFKPLLELVGPKNILFGTDYPWGRLTMLETLEGLLKQGFSNGDLRLIERDNAVRLFPRFGT
jgi:6-methylsalicylate decarboxylase